MLGAGTLLACRVPAFHLAYAKIQKMRILILITFLLAQVWKLRSGKWQIVADILVPVTKAGK